jgi:pimeloyl-ACP methyl ester carboxylesterase
MKILYFHGLNGSLSDEKRTILENQFIVEAPQIDYENDDINALVDQLTEHHRIDAVIGNSMGSYVGYHVARNLSVPCLLFNPAIAERSIEINFQPEDFYGNHPSPVHIVIGKCDEVVLPSKSLEAMFEDKQNDAVFLSLHRKLEHRIDVETFKSEVGRFCKELL